MLVYSGKQGQYIIKLPQIWAIKNEIAYLITYSAQAENYHKYLGNANYMISAFEIGE